MRIVSLLPSATEVVYALGLGDRLAGVTFECDHPPEATSKPVVSTTSLPADRPLDPAEIDGLVKDHMAAREPLYRLDRERIASIQPDLILTQDLCRVCAVPTGQVEDALDALGCSARVVSMDPRTLDEVLDTIVAVGGATGAEDAADALVASLRGRIDAVRHRAAPAPRPRTLALEWADPPWIGGHWIPEMVAIAGGEPLLNDPGEPSRTVTWEEIALAAPDVVVFMPCGFGLGEAERQSAGVLDELGRAGVDAGVYAADGSSYFSRPGPRLVDGLEILAWVLGRFPEPPPGRISRLR